MTLKEKLNYFKEKIGNTTDFNADFKNLIGIELFDYIHSNEPLKDEFERRLYYLKNLADNKEFNILQDNLFEAIQKIIRLTSLKEVKECQKKWNNALFNRLKGIKGKEKNEDFLTMPELYVALQNKNNYYRLQDNSYFSPLDGEISFTHHIVPVKKQYEIVESFFEEVFLGNPKYQKNEKSPLKELLNDYNDYWYKFDNLIYLIPVKLHSENFEKFFLDCVEFYPRKGYELHYNLFKNSTLRQTETQFNKVKKNAIVVIDDLIDFIETRHSINTEEIGKMPVSYSNNVIDDLERYYNTFINQQNYWHFFSGLARYVKFVLETPETDKIISLVVKNRNEEKKKVKEYEDVAIKEIGKAKDIIWKVIGKNKISDDRLQRLIDRHGTYEISSESEAERLDHSLASIIRWLAENGHKNLVKNLIREENGIIYTNENEFSRKIEDYYKAEQELDEKKEIEEWGAWENLCLVYLVIYKRDEEMQRLRKNDETAILAINFAGLAGEMQHIKEGKITNRLTGVVRDFEPTQFLIDDYTNYTNVIHNHLIRGLNKIKELKIEPPKVVEDFGLQIKANKEMAKRFFEKAELTEEIKNSVLTEIQNNKQEKSGKKSPEKINLNLDRRGNLCNEKGKCYEMGETSKRHKLIRFLTENSDYQPTKLITDSVGYQNNQTTSGEIIKIRKNIKRDLSIKGKEFLEAKKDSGYRINPKYKIKIND
ncbi:MAG: hypothetical protein A2904_01145 [Candidatus Staskawiczbacteria bacterium RIFCSPLOWO2_01_FULL_33_9]|uniref:Uncharacterized protein n=1 Tax=Candidatus Staskawiczbacteria bacterium RIFCSPLOWO2_01_FULL_33_9 TaxID=1802211 RepID=A0A1G2I605_9BACT|nr:MAG: hypothetical protein A2904_01145 [Candidatus Staskawiczbacteria bacterium RIFCSPLOWO2_01_FULL_33_9]